LHAFIKFSKNFHLVPAFMSERKAIAIYLNVSKGETKVKKDVFPFIVYQCFKWKFEEEASDKQLCEIAKKYLESFSKKLNLA